jgi:hypothetical protein
VGVVTAQVVSSLVPPTLVTGARSAGSGGTARLLPVPAWPPSAAGSLVCGTATIDCNGRLTEATVITALGWTPDIRLDIRVREGLVVVTADPHAVFTITQPGQVRLPATVRHWCGLSPGTRVLLAAEPTVGLLVIHPPAAVDTMIGQFHALVLGGENP